MARGLRLNISIVLAAVHGLSGLFRAVSAVEPSLCRPLPTLSASPIGHLASVDVKHQESKGMKQKQEIKHSQNKLACREVGQHRQPEPCIVSNSNKNQLINNKELWHLSGGIILRK